MHSTENSTPNSSTDYPYSYKSYSSTPSDDQLKDNWYHGELDENEANNLLNGLQIGTFLVRKNGCDRFYMSIVDLEKVVRHVPIRQINKCYFFNGQRYDSIKDLVDCSNQAKFPLKMDNSNIGPTIDFHEVKYMCTKAFNRCEIDEMSADVGDILSVFETDDPEWIMGRNETNGTIGLIPNSNLEPLTMEVENLNDLPYYYDMITTEKVQLSPIGSFILRRSSKGADTYALLVKTQYDLVEKFLIVGSPSRGFYVSGRPFPTIGHVLNRYCDRPISGGVRLTHAVCIKKRNVQQNLSEIIVNKSNINKMMTRSQYEESKPKRALRIFRGTSIDTALASSSFLSPAGTSTNTEMPSAASTISAGFPEECEKYNDEDNTETFESSCTIVASTTALRKSREDKNWKECWITLSNNSMGSSQLAIFDSMGSKRRQTIDLSACTVFWLDESVFSADGCVLMSPSMPQQQSIFLCFRPFSSFLKWIRMLRSRTIFQDVPPSMSQSTISYSDPISQMSLLFVEIEKYRSESLKSDVHYSVNVLLNGIKVCSSNSFVPTSNKNSNETPCVVIDSKFVIPCIPTSSNNVQLAIVAHSSAGKRARACGVSPLVSLTDSSEVQHVPSADVGFTFRAQKHRFPVLTLERYRPLIDAIGSYPTQLFRWPLQVLPQQHKIFLYSCVSYLYTLDPGNMRHVFGRIIDDVLLESNAEDVFRKDSLATGIVTQCLRNLFKTSFDEFLQEKSTFTKQLQQNGSIDAMTETLVNFVDQSLVTIPLASDLLAVAAGCAQKRFCDEPHLVKRTLSALLILRVLNPIIFTTLSNGIGSQLAKSVQTCANQAASRSTDESLTGAAATIRRIFDRMIILANQKEEVEEKCVTGEMNTEWLSCIAHLIGTSLTLKSTNVNSAISPEEAHNSLPLAVLELVRLHQ